VQYLDDAIARLKKDISELTRERTLRQAQHPNRVHMCTSEMRNSKLSSLRYQGLQNGISQSFCTMHSGIKTRMGNILHLDHVRDIGLEDSVKYYDLMIA